MRSIMNIIEKTRYMLAGVLLLACATACSDDDDETVSVVTSMEIAGTQEGVVYLTENDTWEVSVQTLPGDAVDAADYAYTYTSSDAAVFTVSETGVVTAMGAGEAALTVWSANNTDLWASCIISVEKRIYPVASIEIPEAYRDYYMPQEGMLELSRIITVLPDNATNAEVVYSSSDPETVEVNGKGQVYAKKVGDAVITIKAIDGSGVTTACHIHVREVAAYNNIDRAGWGITASHPYFADAVIGGQLENLIDDNLKTCLAMVKPGKSAGGIKVAADEEVYFVIDMQQAKAFNYFCLRHRSDNTSANLRVTKVDISGSNDGENFDMLVENQAIATNISEVNVVLPGMFNYRYFKLRITGWNTGGNTIQMSDFNIGKVVYAE